MAYTINKTDGSILATVADGQVDNLSSDITLIGKNYSGFGESLNENLVKVCLKILQTMPGLPAQLEDNFGMILVN